jgi:hypothetical protein
MGVGPGVSVGRDLNLDGPGAGGGPVGILAAPGWDPSR